MVVQCRGKRDTQEQNVPSDQKRISTLADETQNSKPSGTNRVQQLGDFELRKKLGKGGMGEVYLARQISLDRLVALKTLSKELAKRGDFVARFEREAKSMAKIDHPNVVKIYAVDSFKGIYFAAIEYIDGQSIQKWLDALGRFSVADAVHVAIICAEALNHAHAENMVHRDIKPDNILVTKKGVVKVADFGLAKVLDEDVSMTQSGTGLGTPLYMAPEQARSAKYVDQRCDIYALGATLYHMLTGKLPYMGNTALELIIAKEKGNYPSARKIRAEVPERLDLIVDKMMAKEASHRHKNCDEVIHDLLSLGVHSESLSFIGSGTGAAATGGTSQINSRASSPASLSPNQTAAAARKSLAATEHIGGDTPASSTRIWFVQFEDAKGRTVVEKHSTGRILKMLAAGQLSAKARTKASPDGSYFPLAQFPEFTKAVEDSLVRLTAGIRKEDMGNLYRKVEKEQKSFQFRRKMKDLFRNTFGIIKLVLLLAAMGAAVWFAVPYLKEIPGKVADKVGLGEKPADTSSPSSDTPTGIAPTP